MWIKTMYLKEEQEFVAQQNAKVHIGKIPHLDIIVFCSVQNQ